VNHRPAGGERRRRHILILLVPLALAGALLVTTRLALTGRLAGLYLVRSPDGRHLALQDDLELGEEERLVAGLDLAGLRRWLAPPAPRGPHLEVAWDGEDAGAVVTSLLPDGRTLETAFGRYLHDDGRRVHGLFTGGARPEVVHALALDESGMSVRDGAGWHHVWCTANEAVRLEGDGRVIDPPDWRLVGARQVVATAAQVVLESEHRLDAGATRLAMHRRVSFQAGQPFFRLDVRYTNVGEGPVVLSTGYGDEPWVGRFGSAEGNLGWLRDGLVERAGRFSTRVQRWAGVVDVRSGLANFITWEGAGPDLVYFSNHAGPPGPGEVGAPLASNEIAIGLEWHQRRLEPAGTLALQLVVGLASTGPDGLPALPAGALGARR
jgi:hypothetical protein